MIFVESIKHKNIETASWAFPLFLLLLNLSIPPILWAGQSMQLSIPADFYVLGITLDSGSSVLPILTFMGGLSAASAMIIVSTLALARTRNDAAAAARLFDEGDCARTRYRAGHGWSDKLKESNNACTSRTNIMRLLYSLPRLCLVNNNNNRRTNRWRSKS